MQLHLDLNRPDIAESLFEEGLKYQGQNPNFLAPYLKFLFGRQTDSRVITVCKELLPLLAAANERDQLLALAAATA